MENSTAKSDVTVRRATPADAETCGRICYEAFAALTNYHKFALELPAPEAGIGLASMLFSHPGFYCLVAEVQGRLVGSNCLDERGPIGAIGPITVAPDAQNASVGRLLMQAILDRVRERGFPGVRLLQAAYHNRSLSLYTKLGFDVREPMSVMQGPPIKKEIEGCTVRPANEADLDVADRICSRVHGHTRSGELREAIGQGHAVVVERSRRITGYASGLGYFGHAVAESNQDLQALIASGAGFSGPGMIVPMRNSVLLRWCLENGLRIVQPLTLMSIGLYNEPAGVYLPSIMY